MRRAAIDIHDARRQDHEKRNAGEVSKHASF
jgi:hypothetical protein